MGTSILWLRRDLRRADHPALDAAAEAADGGRVHVVFVLDPAFFDHAGPVRQAWLAHTLEAAREAYDGRLTIRAGEPVEVIAALARELGAGSVHVSRETEPAGHARDVAVADALRGGHVAWVETGSPYAVTPGRVVSGQGTPFKVFTPFSKAWRTHGWRPPCAEPAGLRLGDAPSDPDAEARLAAARTASGPPALAALPPAGEAAALERWQWFLADALPRYASDRDRPDVDGTSRLSPYLKFGVVHPRTLLADLAAIGGDGAERYVTELAWREFYADVLWHHPGSVDADLRPALEGLAYDDPDTGAVSAWREGRTGFPIVDAGQRQLLAEGWMHNRVRMISASFLTKDLHVWWPVGARHFLDHLADGDLASNAHGWQWVAGTGTDASPYFRVFNPVTQGVRFDPDGAYVRRWVPELSHLAGAAAHEPWTVRGGLARGYPERIVDHAAQRLEALERYRRAREG